jgi:hypothetical protein
MGYEGVFLSLTPERLLFVFLCVGGVPAREMRVRRKQNMCALAAMAVEPPHTPTDPLILDGHRGTSIQRGRCLSVVSFSSLWLPITRFL